jgi:hypothetical protein
MNIVVILENVSSRSGGVMVTTTVVTTLMNELVVSMKTQFNAVLLPTLGNQALWLKKCGNRRSAICACSNRAKNYLL